jgi:hypothetical protein
VDTGLANVFIKGFLMIVSPPRLEIFDGRDVADETPELDEVFGYYLQPCPHCDTVRDQRYPFCCELSTEVSPALALC